MKNAIIVLVMSVVLAACEDRAQPDYAQCVQAEVKGDILGAETFCQTAIDKDPTSDSGEAAAAKLKSMRPSIEAAKKAQAEAEAKAAEEKRKAEEAAKKAAEEARLARVKQLRTKVKGKFWDLTPNGECQGRGMPPYRMVYEGAAYTENTEVAYADGCQKLHQSPEIMQFCCPKGPDMHRLQLQALGF